MPKHTAQQFIYTVLLSDKTLNKMSLTVNERLKILMAELKINVPTLARTLGISDSTLRNYTERHSKPGYDILEKLHHSFKQVNLYWLFGDVNAPMFNNTGEEPTIKQVQTGGKNFHIGTNHGTAAYQLSDCEKERDSLRTENELLRGNLADKERIIRLYEGQQSK